MSYYFKKWWDSKSKRHLVFLNHTELELGKIYLYRNRKVNESPDWLLYSETEPLHVVEDRVSDAVAEITGEIFDLKVISFDEFLTMADEQ